MSDKKNSELEKQPKYVWLCPHSHEGIERGLATFDADLDGGYVGDEKQIYQKIATGYKVDISELPDKLYAPDRWNSHLKPRVSLMNSGCFIVTKQAREILEQCNMGQSAFYPLEIYNPDKKTKWAEDYFHFNIANRKNSFIPEKSKSVKKLYSRTRDIWSPRHSAKNDDIIFSSQALDGPDCWMDERLLNCFLISDRLATFLGKAKILKDWHLVRCLVE